jgi:opacity protein-like surface antigen
MRKYIISLSLFFVLSATCVVSAQEHKQIVIDLNTGYQVKGEVMEQTSTGIKIKASNGEVYEYKSEEIKGMQDAKQPSSPKPNKPFSSAKKDALPIQEGIKPQVGQGIFSYHLGLAIPTGNFANGVGLGLNIGGQYLYPISEGGLSLFAGIDLNYNALKKSVRDETESDIDVTYPKFLNIPVSGGLHYTYFLNEKVSLYGKGGPAVSFLKITNEKYSYGGNEETYKYDLSTKVGFIVGGGLILNNKLDIALSYWRLGKHEITGETKKNGVTEKLDSTPMGESIFTLTVGFKF